MGTKKALPYDRDTGSDAEYDVARDAGFGWIAWRTKGGWSVTHAVVGAEVMGTDILGYYTMCGHVVPKNALEVIEGAGRKVRGIAKSRPLERQLGAMTGITMGVDYLLCKHCRREIDRLPTVEEIEKGERGRDAERALEERDKSLAYEPADHRAYKCPPSGLESSHARVVRNEQVLEAGGHRCGNRRSTKDG